MDEEKKFWKGDESGLAHDLVVALLVGVGLFMLVIGGIYAAGYRLAGLPF